VTKFLPQPREVGAPSIVNREQFLHQFKAFTRGIFEGFDFSNVVVIGGSVIGSLLPIPANPLQEDAANEEEATKQEDAANEEGETKKSNKKGKKKKKSTKKEERATQDTTPLSPDEQYYATLSSFKSSDIDLCIYGLEGDDYTSKLRQIYEHIATKVGKKKLKIYRSNTTVTLCALFPFRHVQITLT
jgi:hypothetical protein